MTRLDAVTGERLDVYPVPDAGAASRVISTDRAIYVNGSPLTRIDPVTGAISYIDMGDLAFSVIGHGNTVWTAGRSGAQRIDADRVVTDLEIPGAIWIDLAVADGLVWAVSQGVDNRLIAFDGDTGEVLHDPAIVEGFTTRALPVRLVADRSTLEITDVFVGFSLAVDTDGDGSVWGIGGIPGSANSESMVRRLAPGDHQP